MVEIRALYNIGNNIYSFNHKLTPAAQLSFFISSPNDNVSFQLLHSKVWLEMVEFVDGTFQILKMPKSAKQIFSLSYIYLMILIRMLY